MRNLSMSAGNAARKDSNHGWWTGRMNQIFLLTCLASLALQLFSSWASWHKMDGSRRLGMAQEDSRSGLGGLEREEGREIVD